MMLSAISSTSQEPRVLIVCNNAFSDTRNNGKTLASFFSDFSPENVAQLYFSEEVPCGSRAQNYFRITDREVLCSVFNRSRQCGSRIQSRKTIADPENRTISYHQTIRNFQSARLVRELAWKIGRWKTKQLSEWLWQFSPQVVFFCAGDSGFAYRAVDHIRTTYNAKLIVYVTDDYILPRRTLNPMWWIHRNDIFQKMKVAVRSADLFITISARMRDVYRDLLGKDSIIAVNMSESLRGESISAKKKDGPLTLVYAGGLHFKRYETLHLLAGCIRTINEAENKKKLLLKIYSYVTPEPAIRRKLCIDGASEYGGSLNPMELRQVLNACDIPVHVESFDRKCIESTRLSFSTKISEYLSLGKPVLAIGPSEVASMEYLQGAALCVTDKRNLLECMTSLVNSSELLSELSRAARLRYEESHQKEKQIRLLRDQIMRVMLT